MQRTFSQRCKYFATQFCASGSCPTPPPCTFPGWNGPADCNTIDPSTRKRIVCKELACPCWLGYEPALAVREAYNTWLKEYSRTHLYDSEEDLYNEY